MLDDDILNMMAFAVLTGEYELARCRTLRDQIRECLLTIGELYVLEPVDWSIETQQEYWAIYIGLRCLLVEHVAEEIVCRFFYTWAVTYLDVMSMMAEEGSQ